MYDNKNDNFCKGIFKKNSKDQRLPSTRGGGVKVPVITIKHEGKLRMVNCASEEALSSLAVVLEKRADSFIWKKVS